MREPRAGFARGPVVRRNRAPELPARDVALGQPSGAHHQDEREQQRDGGGGEQGGGRPRSFSAMARTVTSRVNNPCQRVRQKAVSRKESMASPLTPGRPFPLGKQRVSKSLYD